MSGVLSLCPYILFVAEHECRQKTLNTCFLRHPEMKERSLLPPSYKFRYSLLYPLRQEWQPWDADVLSLFSIWRELFDGKNKTLRNLYSIISICLHLNNERKSRRRRIIKNVASFAVLSRTIRDQFFALRGVSHWTKSLPHAKDKNLAIVSVYVLKTNKYMLLVSIEHPLKSRGMKNHTDHLSPYV